MASTQEQLLQYSTGKSAGKYFNVSAKQKDQLNDVVDPTQYFIKKFPLELSWRAVKR